MKDAERCYEGELQNWLPHGTGSETSLTDDSGLPRYVGSFVEGKRHGAGVCTLSEGVTLSGTWRHGQYHGVMTKAMGPSRREVEYVDGVPSRIGTMSNSDACSHYKGEIKDFLLCGIGELTYSDNAVHRGEFAHDEPHGPGTLTFPDGAVLSGNFKLGKINGSMVFRTPGSTRFLDCIDGEAAGTPGTIKFDDGGHYEGDMTPFKPHGKGVHTHPGGQVYRGEFERGLPHGVGEVTFPNGRAVLTGTWRDGRAHGMMTMTTDAYISKVEFVMGFAAHTGTVQYTDGRTYQGRMHMFLPQVADGGSTQHDPAFKTLGLQPALGRPFGIGAPPTTAPQSAPNAFGPKPASGAPGTPQAAPNAFGPKPASGAPFAFGVAPPSASSVPLTSSPHATTVCPDSCSRLEDKGNIAL